MTCFTFSLCVRLSQANVDDDDDDMFQSVGQANVDDDDMLSLCQAESD